MATRELTGKELARLASGRGVENLAVTCEGDQGTGPCGTYLDWCDGTCANGHTIEITVRDWNDLDHDRLNDSIGDRTSCNAQYAAACKRAVELFDGSQDEESLAKLAVEAAGGWITEDDKRQLGKLTTRDDAGRHFTEAVDGDWLDRMESAGLIAISRPTHEATGIAYDRQYWSVEVAPEVITWFDECGELIQ